ncbi:hypothetical protein R1538_25745 [Rhizobium leguminosarum]|uniref:hypothetical protein n=1 Tax=Rhizobium leguminosarum TaxID=384 RepID=UPI0013EED4F1|nr:hypothetical protein [Rhizobium leguminosarum]MDV4164515.1 hypothetical protein [Rhizobium leguminosarum]MDV4174766.1 hypothetical protein [Rhizobium leguminosarum]
MNRSATPKAGCGSVFPVYPFAASDSSVIAADLKPVSYDTNGLSLRHQWRVC